MDAPQNGTVFESTLNNFFKINKLASGFVGIKYALRISHPGLNQNINKYDNLIKKDAI